MSYRIAITGKGGVGKTTISALLINRLIQAGNKPVLAIDADPNSCLDTAMGVAVSKSVGTVREQVREIAGKGISTGMSKQQLLEFKIAESLVEAENFDLIAMGRPEGPGCYCYANNVLKYIIEEIAGSYPFVVMDNEAGLENLSRRIMQQVNLLILIADPSGPGLKTVLRLFDLAKEMGIKYEKLAIIINRLRKQQPPERMEQLKSYTNGDFMVVIRDNPEIAEFSENSGDLTKLPENNAAVKTIDAFISELGIKN